ncbi:MAG: amino-acid N-acetyltransferase [Burkholderiales bacterium]|nr:amino-acid N-acetyltransferase [Burkholderiales bacterium]
MPSSSNAAFVQWFRRAAPYIHAFGGKTFVIAFGGEVVADGGFIGLTHDLNLLASLEIKLVLVHGARPQIENRLLASGIEPRYVNGIRITDAETLQCAKESIGRVRVEIEALLSMGLANSPMANAQIRVASGNFVTARPIGVIDGVDLLHTGETRKIDAAGIRACLDDNDVVLLSPLGYSPTGEIFNLTLEDVALQTAVALSAEKLIFMMDAAGITDRKGQLLRELTAAEADAQLQTDKGKERAQHIPDDVALYLPCAAQACRAGVQRAHLISRHLDGALLLELFTRDGIGTMVTRDALQKLRPANINDIAGILALIEPLEQQGVLVRRSRELLEREVNHFVVVEHDGRIVGCAALYPFAKNGAGELACLTVESAYRDSGAGQSLLDNIEAKARRQKIRKLFVLTTRAAHWFIERGFSETDVDSLPPRRQSLYNYSRRSKIFVKPLPR